MHDVRLKSKSRVHNQAYVHLLLAHPADRRIGVESKRAPITTKPSPSPYAMAGKTMQSRKPPVSIARPEQPFRSMDRPTAAQVPLAPKNA
mmetsp:Transcript_3036/g.6745  ORF Transcript_3036/g.6745 Transcript_3036/m.6745 type:complete len:90 (+) Transcript_3036:314-583(+)